ncbi:MAG: bifunctional 4-hydroxy-2-oxoglutarate aldolase/2-dehydro-3-deoxy-phosphogluconate aldolase [Candidatus Aminicenantes bacterium]|nr:bifunctional 4-hydroxy-2-oxoglutarate aldolase/2-dehydro-3-deoxy-phosphogluconate aldolase [Candidatus Aminicenantes bacterium]
MKREDALEIILTTKIIAVIRMSNPAKLRSVVEAIQRGGVKAIEITLTTPGALDSIRDMAAAKPAGVLIGAGTVLDAASAATVIRAGADFVVSPVLDREVIRVCRESDTFVAPGAFTPTEILAAWRLGADVVKVFPATSVGPKFFKDMKGPFPQIRLMPTGGVDLVNAADFIGHGASCVAIGTALLDPKSIANDDWEGLTAKAEALVKSLSQAGAGPRR